jgi:hypothetical protein
MVFNIIMSINVHLLVNGKISNYDIASNVSVIIERNGSICEIFQSFARKNRGTPSPAKSLDRIINSSWKIGFEFRVRYYRETWLQLNHFRCAFERMKMTSQN